MKLIPPVLLAAALAVAFYAGRQSAGPPEPPGGAHPDEHSEAPNDVALSAAMQRKFDVQFAAALVRTLGTTIEATGSVQPNASRLAHIRALARGRIDDVYVRLGDRVRAGQPLLTYDNIDLGDAIGEYLAALAELQKAAAEAEVSRDRKSVV